MIVRLVRVELSVNLADVERAADVPICVMDSSSKNNDFANHANDKFNVSHFLIHAIEQTVQVGAPPEVCVPNVMTVRSM